MNLPGVYKTFINRWDKYQTVWIISDTHFREDDLKEAFPKRPTDEELVKRINKFVGRHDILIHLGDTGDLEWIRKLHGYKILCMGNHDTGAEKYREVFDEVYEGPIFLGEKLILSHEPIYFTMNFPFFNIHGHVHSPNKALNNEGIFHKNVCCDVCNYEPFHLNSFLKNGGLKQIKSIHRQTIDKAVERKER